MIIFSNWKILIFWGLIECGIVVGTFANEIDTVDALAIGKVHTTKITVDSKHGSCVLLDLRDDGTATFVTAFHVIADAREIVLSVQDSRETPKTIASSSDNDFEFFVNADADIAMLRTKFNLQLLNSEDNSPRLRIPLNDSSAADLRPVVGVRKFAELKQTRDDKDFPCGFAIGYATYSPNDLTPIPLQLGRARSAKSLYAIYSGSVAVNKDVQFQLSSSGSTAPGMSGGLVIDSSSRFVGLVHGRVIDTINLIIPADAISKTYQSSQEAGATWIPFMKDGLPTEKAKLALAKSNSPYDPDRFVRRRPFYVSPFKSSDEKYYNFVRWNDLSLYGVYFDDPASLRIGFQELMFNEKHFSSETKPNDYFLTINKESFPDGERDQDQQVRVWINHLPGELGGNPIQITRNVVNKQINLGKYLHEGENLIVIRKENLAANDELTTLNLRGLFKDSPIDFSIGGGNDTYRVFRSLPGITKGYEIYVTVELPARVHPHDAYVAAKIDWVEKVLRNLPIDIGIDQLHQESGSSFRGSLHIAQSLLNPAEDKHLLVAAEPKISYPLGLSQHYDMLIPMVLKTESVFANFFGIQYSDESQRSLPIEARLRFQWVHRGGNNPILFGVRVLSARPTGNSISLPIKLGEMSLGIDIGPAVQELLVGYLNREIIHAEKPAVDDSLAFDKILESLHGVDKSPLEGFVPEQMFVKDGWIAMTLVSKSKNLAFRELRLPQADSNIVVDLQGFGANVGRTEFFTLIRDDQVENKLLNLLPEQLPPFSMAMQLAGGEVELHEPVERDINSLGSRLAKEWIEQIRAGEPRGAVKTSADLFPKLIGHLSKRH